MSLKIRKSLRQYGSCSSSPGFGLACTHQQKMVVSRSRLHSCLSLCVLLVVPAGSQPGQPGTYTSLSRQCWPAYSACRSGPTNPGGQNRSKPQPTGVWGSVWQNWTQDGGNLKLQMKSVSILSLCTSCSWMCILIRTWYLIIYTIFNFVSVQVKMCICCNLSSN